MRLICLTKEEVAKEVADRILNLVEKKPNCILGLATGSTPIETYNEIIKGTDKQPLERMEKKYEKKIIWSVYYRNGMLCICHNYSKRRLHNERSSKRS